MAAVTEDGRRLPFNVLQEVYEAYFWFFKRCEEYFLVRLGGHFLNELIFSFPVLSLSSLQCKYQPPQGIASVGQHIELEIGIYLQRYPPQHRHVRRLVFDYLLKRECCITGCDSMEHVDLLGIGSYTELPGKCKYLLDLDAFRMSDFLRQILDRFVSKYSVRKW